MHHLGSPTSECPKILFRIPYWPQMPLACEERDSQLMTWRHDSNTPHPQSIKGSFWPRTNHQTTRATRGQRNTALLRFDDDRRPCTPPRSSRPSLWFSASCPLGPIDSGGPTSWKSWGCHGERAETLLLEATHKRIESKGQIWHGTLY